MKKPAAKTVGKPAQHAKAAKAGSGAHKKTKATASRKHKAAAKKKHQPTAHAKHLQHVAHEEHIGKAPLLVGDVACCSAEALAASLRASGATVADEDVLSLYWRTARDPDSGASLLATLRAASEFGLAGHRPRWFRPFTSLDAEPGRLIHTELPGGPHSLYIDPAGRGVWSWGDIYDVRDLKAGPPLEVWVVAWH